MLKGLSRVTGKLQQRTVVPDPPFHKIAWFVLGQWVVVHKCCAWASEAGTKDMIEIIPLPFFLFCFFVIKNDVCLSYCSALQVSPGLSCIFPALFLKY